MAEILIPLFIAAVGLPLIGQVFLAVTDVAARPEGLSAAASVLVRLVEAAPAVCMAFTLVALRAVFLEYENGRLLSVKASAGFRRAGLWALAGFGVRLLLDPAVAVALGLRPWADALRFDTFGIGLLAVSGFVLMIGGVLETAARTLQAQAAALEQKSATLQADLDEIV